MFILVLYFAAQSPANLMRSTESGLLGQVIAPFPERIFHPWWYEAMKRFLKTTLLLPLALAGSMLIAQDDPDAKQPPEKGQAEQNSKRATVGKIVKSGDSKYVLVDVGGTVYQLDDQTTSKKFVGKIVKVSGTVDEANSTIHVTDITPAVEQAR